MSPMQAQNIVYIRTKLPRWKYHFATYLLFVVHYTYLFRRVALFIYHQAPVFLGARGSMVEYRPLKRKRGVSTKKRCTPFISQHASFYVYVRTPNQPPIGDWVQLPFVFWSELICYARAWGGVGPLICETQVQAGYVRLPVYSFLRRTKHNENEKAKQTQQKTKNQDNKQPTTNLGGTASAVELSSPPLALVGHTLAQNFGSWGQAPNVRRSVACSGSVGSSASVPTPAFADSSSILSGPWPGSFPSEPRACPSLDSGASACSSLADRSPR